MGLLGAAQSVMGPEVVAGLAEMGRNTAGRGGHVGETSNLAIAGVIIATVILPPALLFFVASQKPQRPWDKKSSD
eukprot:g39779.t1